MSVILKLLSLCLTWLTIYYLTLFNAGCLKKQQMNKYDIISLIGLLLLVSSLYVFSLGYFKMGFITIIVGGFTVLFSSVMNEDI